MMTGMCILRQKSARSSDLYSVEICLTVETVDWTTKRSAPGLLGDAAEALGLLRNGTDGGQHAGGLQFLDAPGDQLLLDRLGIDLLNEAVTSSLPALTICSRTSSGLA